ncbi:MAG: substrate-binding domain-containing protein, partial [Bradyrhizobium sp.]
MMGKSSATRLVLAVTGGLLLCSIAGFTAAAAEPAEVKVLTSVALTSVFDEIAPQFQQATGSKLKIGFSLIADIKKRMIAGETADVIILSRPAMDDLQKLE